MGFRKVIPLRTHHQFPQFKVEYKMKYAIVILVFFSLQTIIPSDAGCFKYECLNVKDSFERHKNVKDWETCARMCNKHKSCSYWHFQFWNDGDNPWCRFFNTDDNALPGYCMSGHHTCTSNC